MVQRNLWWMVRMAALILPLAGAGAAQAEPFAQIWRPSPSAEVFANPERGWVWPFNPECCAQDLPHPPLRLEELKFIAARPEDIRLIRDLVQLGASLDGPLSDMRLAQIDADWAAIRQAGLKVIPRFLYDYSEFNREPPGAVIAGHIDQLRPLLQRNADIIAWVEAGLFGGSGEGAASGQGHVFDDPESGGWQRLSPQGIALYAQLFAALPPARCLTVRYPRFRWDLQASGLMPADACIGYYNDGFAGDENSFAFLVLPGERALVETDPQPVPMGGELSLSNEFNRAPGVALALMRTLRQTSLNLNATDALPTMDAWRASGDFAAMSREMGYRLRVVELALPACIPPAGEVPVRLVLRNDGMAAPVNPRPVRLVAGDGAADLPVDLRDLAPGETRTFDLTLHLEAGGAVALWLPDPAPALAQRAAFAIRLAHAEGWDAQNGLNRSPLMLEPCP